MKRDFSALFEAIGYPFTRTEVLVRALTHRSVGPNNNERMEFLGDALLDVIIAEHLLEVFPAAREGELSRLRSTLVKKESLARIARTVNLGQFLVLGPGEMKTGGHRRESILADALEALICAVYLDGGVEASRAMVMHCFRDALDEVERGDALKDPKSRLQEFLQRHNRPLPNYEMRELSAGEQHLFAVDCFVDGMQEPTRGHGRSRRKAEQAAAARALERLLEAESRSA